MVIIRILFIYLIIFSNIILATQPFEITASLSRSKIYNNENVVLTLSVVGADKDLYKSITQPELSGDFTIISTSQSSSFSFVNGVSSRTRSYSYNLLPLKPGIFIIDPFKINYDGKEFSTKPIRLVVREGSAAKPNQAQQPTPTVKIPYPSINSNINQQDNQNIFLETQISTNNIFLGESFDYSIKLYRRVRIFSSVSINQSDMQDVWQNSYEVSPEKIVRKNGQRYYELELVKKQIRPLTPGIISLPPLFARFIIDPFSGEIQLASKPVTINVNELPEPRPDSFTGAIGNYTMLVSEPKINLDANAFQLKLSIEGTGNIKTIQPPIINESQTFRILSAPLSENELVENKQVFEYVIIPKVTGLIEIPPIEFSFYSKETGAYTTLRSQTLSINVEEDQVSTNQIGRDTQRDIQFLKTNNLETKILAVLNYSNTILFGILINIIILFGFILKELNFSKLFFSKNELYNRKHLIRSIRSMTEETPVVEMEKVLINTLIFYTDYKQKGLNPKDVQKSLVNAELSDSLVKGILKWINNIQSLRYSKDKMGYSAHSNSESLKRMLNKVILEKEKP